FVQADGEGMEKACDALKKYARSCAFTEPQERELSAALSGRDTNVLFAVRSSSPEEDLEGSSFAGGYETVLGVTRPNMNSAIRKAFSSCLDYRVAVYKREHGFDIINPKMAVIVQEQIASDAAGVGFSLNPVTNNFDETVINANWGLGETVVAGLATPDTYVVDKVDLKIISKQCGKKEISIWLTPHGGTQEKADKRHDSYALSDGQIAALANLIIRVEALYKKPIDIEWAYAKGVLYLLQARPITAYVPLPEDMMTAPGQRKRLYLDVSTTLEGLTEPISVAGTSFFKVLIKRVERTLFLRDMSRDINKAIPWVWPGRLYVNVSNILKLVNKKKFADVTTSFDPLTAKTVRDNDMLAYHSDVSRLKLLPFGALFIAPHLYLQMMKAMARPERTHVQVQAKMRSFMDRARTMAGKDMPLAALSDMLLRSLIIEVILRL
ncbi:MAG: PEP/pyruvate-binding domain-containing protein, partial [Candidatus Saccharimonadales bacterium]